jgi:hypothetical protein
LDIVWIAAHSPQAKGRIERSFQTAQDRLVKGLRVAKAGTLEQANAYLEETFLPWWNQKRTVVPARADDAHRPLAATHSLAASLSYVETRQVASDYTIRFDNRIYQIARTDVRTGLRGSQIRVEVRLDDSLAVRFRNDYLTIAECHGRPPREAPVKVLRKPAAPRQKSQWMKNFRFTSQEKTALSGIPSACPAGTPKSNR